MLPLVSDAEAWSFETFTDSVKVNRVRLVAIATNTVNRTVSGSSCWSARAMPSVISILLSIG